MLSRTFSAFPGESTGSQAVPQGQAHSHISLRLDPQIQGRSLALAFPSGSQNLHSPRAAPPSSSPRAVPARPLSPRSVAQPGRIQTAPGQRYSQVVQPQPLQKQHAAVSNAQSGPVHKLQAQPSQAAQEQPVQSTEMWNAISTPRGQRQVSLQDAEAIPLTTPAGRGLQGRVPESPRDQRRINQSAGSGSSLVSPNARSEIEEKTEDDSPSASGTHTEELLLQRIAAIEVDRNGLLAQLSRQQDQLDRLEALARENAALRAQASRRTDPGRRPVSKEIGQGKAEGRGRGRGTISNVTRRMPPGRGLAEGESPPSTLTPRRFLSSPTSPTSVRPAQQVPQLKLPPSGGIARSSGVALSVKSPSSELLKALQGPSATSDGGTQAEILKSELPETLESRLGELEMALGLMGEDAAEKPKMESDEVHKDL